MFLKEYNNINFYNNNYELRSCEKISHNPNYDYPCFSPTLLLDEIAGQEICFVVKKTNNIKFLQKPKDEQLIIQKNGGKKLYME